MTDTNGLPSVRSLMPERILNAVPEGTNDAYLTLCWAMFQAGENHANVVRDEQEAKHDALHEEQVRRLQARLDEALRTIMTRPSPATVTTVTGADASGGGGQAPKMDLSAFTTTEDYADPKGAPGQEADSILGDTDGGDGEGYVDDSDEETGEDGEPAQPPSAKRAPDTSDPDRSVMHPVVKKVPKYLVEGLIQFAQNNSTDPVLAEKIVIQVLTKKVNPGADGSLPRSVGKIITTAMLNRKILRNAGPDGFIESSQGRSEDLGDGAASAAAGNLGMSKQAKEEFDL